MAASPEATDEIPVLELPDKTLSDGVHTVYSPRNTLLTYSVQRNISRPKVQHGNQYLHESTPSDSLYNSCTRKLINESNGIFLQLNAIVNELQESQRNYEISKISQKYRSVILACIEELSSAAEATGDEDLIVQRDMFSEIELVWHLLQSLIIDTQTGSRLLYKLLEWIQWHFLFAERKVPDIVQNGEPHLHSEYWDTIIQFLLQGKTSSARSLLGLHKLSEREDFLSLDELIKKMPMYVAAVGISLNEFQISWKYWQEECKSRLDAGEFSAEPGLVTVCKILCGDTEVLTEKSSLCSNWYHLMVSVLLYTDPCISLSALSNTAKAYYNNVNVGDHHTVVDTIILSVMELDIMGVINCATLFEDNWWFACHLTDLLSHGNYIDVESFSYARRIREFILSNYAAMLMSHRSLWQVAVDYLDQCHESGRALLELYLERIPLDTEAKAKKIIFLAKQRNMDSLIKTVSNVMTSKCIANEKLGTALSWVIQSKDVGFATELANRWMKDYTERKNIQCFEILNNMGPCMLVSDKLTFVGKYCEFHKLYREEDYKLAASLLISLLSSGLAPLSFQMVMLLDALPLLEASDIVFSAKDTYQLMACLEELSRNNVKNGDNSDHNDQENLIRLALVRNLARSFVIEHGPQDHV